MKTINELREMDQIGLDAELLELRKQQFNNRMRQANGSLDKPHVVKQIRRSIARIKTITTEKAGE